jgi:formylglycine-generating enzyme required for sulfatase activity
MSLAVSSTVAHVVVSRRLLFCLPLFLLCCLKNPSAPPADVSVHIVKTGEGRLNVADADTIVKAGTKITLEAFPDTGMLFVGWFGSLRSTLDSVTFAVIENMNIEARFRPFPRESRMVEIASKNKTFVMGSNSGAARQIEKPAHSVRFTYTFFMDRNEVTQRQYEAIMGVNPAKVRGLGAVAGIGDSFPVYAVTWYEAALFCNARSKAAGLDTVYDFTAVCRENQECPYVLENLDIRYDRFGFRLPTEAEWEFACRAGSTRDYFWGADYPDSSGMGGYAWYTGNSGVDEEMNKVPHVVGVARPNGFGLFDMTGNVAEWTNDRIGPYRDSLTVDPAGPYVRFTAVSDDSLQCPVRGGSFDLGMEYLKSWMRKGEYDTPAKLCTKDIGFRCVLGVLFPAATTGPKERADTSGVQSCNLSDLLNFFGTTGIKCVFVKESAAGRKLWFIDFSEPGRPVHPLPDSLAPHCPAVSPDGQFVAYSSMGENGFSGAAVATVRRLDSREKGVRSSPGIPAFVPRWWVDQNNLDTFIVFPNNTVPDDDLPLWKKGKTYRQKIAGGMFVDMPVVICDTGSFNGGLSYDGVFLATGFRRPHVLNLTSNDLYAYFDSLKTGTSYSLQVCNVSINPGYENQDEIMFLDFGCSSVNSIIGRPYGLHEIIFTATSADSIRWYEKPEGYGKWEDVEWSNNQQFAVAAALADENGERTSVFCIDLKNNTQVKILEGNNILEPFLWIDPVYLPPAQDPYYNFAKYNIPGKLSNGQMPLCKKLKLFWSQFNNLQGVIVGGSPTYFGIDPEFIPTVKTLNMATFSSDPLTSCTLSVNYACTQISNLKIIIMGLDAYALAFNRENPYLNGLPRTLGYLFDVENKFWKKGLPQEIKAKIASFDSTHWQGFDLNGYIKEKPLGNSKWGDTTFQNRVDYTFEDTTIQKNILVFKELAKELASRKAHLLVINFPENPNYKKTDYIGSIGPRRSVYAKISEWLGNLEKQNAYFHFYDANMDGNHDYTDAEAFDCNHLNYLGAKKLSTRVDSLCALYLK